MRGVGDDAVHAVARQHGQLVLGRGPAPVLTLPARDDDQRLGTEREVFVAIVVNGVPLDALADRLGSNRNALYKMMFDARRKLRAALAANGYLDDDDSGGS